MFKIIIIYLLILEDSSRLSRLDQRVSRFLDLVTSRLEPLSVDWMLICLYHARHEELRCGVGNTLSWGDQFLLRGITLYNSKD